MDKQLLSAAISPKRRRFHLPNANVLELTSLALYDADISDTFVGGEKGRHLRHYFGEWRGESIQYQHVQRDRRSFGPHQVSIGR